MTSETSNIKKKTHESSKQMSKLTKVLKNIRNNQGIHEKLFTAREPREKMDQIAGEATRRSKQNGD